MNDMIMQPYIVYVMPDEQNRITAINSSAFLPDPTGWVEIDRGFGDRYHHAQGNYLPGPLRDKRGVCRYKLVEGKVVARTQEEMDADWVEPEAEPDLAQQVYDLQESNRQLQEALDLLLSGEVE